MKILVSGGCGFLGSHVVDELVARGREVFVLDDLSTAELEDDGETPKYRNSEAIYDHFPEVGVDGIAHLALRHPVERERSVWETAFRGFVVGGVDLLMRNLDAGNLKRFVFSASTWIDRIGKSPEISLCFSLRKLLKYWHRPPTLGVYCAWTPELGGDRRAVPLPEGVVDPYPVELAAARIADLADGTAPNRVSIDVDLLADEFVR